MPTRPGVCDDARPGGFDKATRFGREVVSVMGEYVIVIDGMEHTIQADEEYASAHGLRPAPVVEAAVPPAPETATVDTKPRRRKGSRG